MSDIVVAAISGASALLCAVVAGMFSGFERRQKKDSEAKAKEARLQLKMLHANSQLTVGVAMALKNGHCNGEVEAGLKAVEAADREYSDFLEGMAIETIRR